MVDDSAMTPREVAETLRIAKNTVYELIKRGELKGYRVGNKFRIDRAEVLAYRKRGSVSGERSETVEPAAEANATRRIGEGERFVIDPSVFPRAETATANAFVLCGQDIMLDLIARELEESSGVRVQRSYLGSYNGLYALYQGMADAATAHLWDGETDSYNLPYLHCLLPGIKVTVIHLATRRVGFYVKTGNPMGLRSWEDLRRPGLRMVNRERGSGIRVLLDERLRTMGIDPAGIEGYQRKCDTHLAVAVTVARGGADFAIGNEKTAAQVAGIEFVPLQSERYELVIPSGSIDLPLCRALVGIVRSRSFREELEGLGGYGLEETGKIVLG
jgi:putative molybdopterin biosynthesis protein